MAKKKTVFVWILLVLMVLWILSGLGTIMSGLVGLANPTGWGIFTLITTIISTGLIITLWIKLFNVKPDVQQWVNYTFGFGVLLGIISMIYVIVSFGIFGLMFSAGMFLFILLLQICMWIGISMHLKRAKKDNLMEFS